MLCISPGLDCAMESQFLLEAKPEFDFAVCCAVLILCLVFDFVVLTVLSVGAWSKLCCA